jgi:two-component system cell cycle response regulator
VPEASAPDPAANKKVLIIDDSITVVKSLSKILRRAGMVPIERLDGSEGFETALHQNPDLILLDLVLPGEDGLGILKKFRQTKQFSSVPIVMITSTREEESIVEALEAGADDYIYKPFHEPVLLARLRTHLRTWQLLQDLENAHAKLLQAREQEVHAERWRTAVEMAGATAHKLNQPLTSIVCYADMMLKKLDDSDEDFRAVKSISEESERMAMILRKMSELTKLRTSEYVGNTTIIDLDRSFEKTDPSISLADLERLTRKKSDDS